MTKSNSINLFDIFLENIPNIEKFLKSYIQNTISSVKIEEQNKKKGKIKMEKAVLEINNGSIVLSKEVIAQYAGCVALATSGIVGMAMISMRDGMYRLLKKESLRKGVEVTINENNEVNIDFHVFVAYGVNIKAVAENVISTVCYEVEAFTGLKVKHVNLYVEGIRVID